MATYTRAVIQIRRQSLGYFVFVFEPGSLNLSWPELSILWAAPNYQHCSSADHAQIIAVHCSTEHGKNTEIFLGCEASSTRENSNAAKPTAGRNKA